MPKYTGSITTSGKSEAIRFEKGLFKQHPEFRQQAKVEAHIIAPGQMLVSVVDEKQLPEQEDPLVSAFLSFIEQDIKQNPDSIKPVDPAILARAEALTKGIRVTDEEIIADDVTF
jgi:antitoxin PrlF